jgi:hypothetical protein
MMFFTIKCFKKHLRVFTPISWGTGDISPFLYPASPYFIWLNENKILAETSKKRKKVDLISFFKKIINK